VAHRGRSLRRAALRRRAAATDRRLSRRRRPHRHGLLPLQGARSRTADRLRAPEALLRPLTVAKQAADLHTSTIDQLAAGTSLQAADIDEHIARLCAEYRRRRDALLDGLAAALPAGTTFNRPAGGMFVWARLPAGWDAGELLVAALRHDVAFVPGAPFFAVDADPRTLRLSFTTHTTAQIVEGLGRLQAAARS
jgi:2-aminoadipate transaminase